MAQHNDFLYRWTGAWRLLTYTESQCAATQTSEGAAGTHPAKVVHRGARVDGLVPALGLGQVVPVQLLQRCGRIALLQRSLHQRHRYVAL